MTDRSLLRNAVADSRTIDAPIEVHPDQERLAAQVLLRQEAPVSAVLAIITIVAHHEIVTRRHHPFALSLIDERQIGAFEDAVMTALQILCQFLGSGHLRAIALALVGAERLVGKRLA